MDLKKKLLTLKHKTAKSSESLMMSFHSSKCTSATTGEISGSEPHHRDPGTDPLSLLWVFHRNGFILVWESRRLQEGIRGDSMQTSNLN